MDRDSKKVTEEEKRNYFLSSIDFNFLICNIDKQKYFESIIY